MPKTNRADRNSGPPAAYARIEYEVPAGSKRNLPRLLQGSPEAKSIYLRAEFFLLYCSGFKPEVLMKEWLGQSKWEAQRRSLDDLRESNIDFSLAALKSGDISSIYQPRRLPVERPLALSFPLLPTQFVIFVARRFAHVQGERSEVVEPGIYRCEVLDWRDDDSYAETIELVDVADRRFYLDQIALLDAIRLQKAAVEAVHFLNMPIYLYTSRKARLPRMRKEQSVPSGIAARPGSPREFTLVDGKLLKLFGGVNPANLLRLSWFYHPQFGVKPDDAKHQKILNKANGKKG